LRFTLLYVLYGASIAALVCSVASSGNGALLRVLEWAPLVSLGRISYGFYLYHGFIPDFARSARVVAMFGASGIPWWAHAASVVASFALTLMLARLSWRFVEEPILRLKNRRFVRKTESSDARPRALTR
jgi:peptidoglycan/LPS O-acetylase OafA/YrhL